MKTLLPEEKITLALRDLYAGYGYTLYKMSKFEEYDTYVRNKAFLASEQIVVFTDTNGKLMALKPDVTLSIVKNTKDTEGEVSKVYYDESVYRVAGDSKVFKEIKQTGVECIGDVDEYCISEVLYLAAESLKTISEDYVLDVANIGILSRLIEATGLSSEGRKQLTQRIKEKNVHGAKELFAEEGVAADKYEKVLEIMTYAGTPDEVIPRLKKLVGSDDAVEMLARVTAPLGPRVRIDFSVVNDMRYYNGIIFQGFVKGVPDAILSGGQYDLLLKKMRRISRAIGFAVRPVLPVREDDGLDVDAVLVYDETVPVETVREEVRKLVAGGERVLAQKVLPKKIRYGRVVRIGEGKNA